MHPRRRPTRTYAADGTFGVRLQVTDPSGATNVSAATPIVVGNDAPTAVIDAATTPWKVGQTITFSGHATDPEEGTLSASRLTWDLTLMHCPLDCHEHPLQTFVGVASGSFAAPDHQYPAHLRLGLTATDAHGLTNRAERDLDPVTVDLTFQTSQAGLSLTVGGAPEPAPFTRRVIVGSKNSLSANSPQDAGGVTYRWTGWSDGGAQSHDITAPQTATTYTATYAPTTDLSVVQTAAVASGRVTFTVTTRNSGVPAASQVSLIDTLPAKMTFSTTGTSPGCTYAAATRQVTCALGTMAGGAVVTTTIVATNGNAKGQVRNEVRVTSTTLDSNTVNNSSTISLKLR